MTGSHWRRLRTAITLNPSKSEVVGFPPEEEVPFLPMEAIGEDGSLALDQARPFSKLQTGYTYFRNGDVLIAKITPCFENGKGAVVASLDTGFGFGTTELIVARPRSECVDSRYLFWIFQSPEFRGFGEGAMYGAGGQKRIPDDFVRNYRAWLPPLPEQTAIAAFLDRETGKIDALVEEQRRLIELLKEKRQAVISHAVTKGLDPNVRMKPSGVEWLGDVPEHWEVVALKRNLEFLTSGSRGWAEHYSDDGALFLRIGNLTRDSLHLDLSDVQRVSVPSGSESERTRVRGGDILFSITAFLGSVAVVPDDLEPAYVSQHLALARLRDRTVLPRWVGYAALSSIGKGHFLASGYGGTKIQLSLDDIALLPIPKPPAAEQRAILAYLDNELTRITSLQTAAEEVIALLQERRSALISAAVTGKIVVRNFNAQEEAA